ncbi:MAG: tyrosine-protein phosphatase [Clostridium sp.]|nr:tyrosine-protein phosphatase [Clostridium sp.]MCM1568752.1 tyrosine-protein phosphatase [Roseburia sp.]
MVLQFEGIRNARDFSEYGNRLCIRAAHLHDMTDGDVEILRNTCHLQTVIDLRTGMEREEAPDRVVDGVCYYSIPLFDEAMIGISHEKNTDSMAGAGAVPDMAGLYRDIVTTDSSVEQIKKVMKIILASDREGAVLWHCTEGKDRCGIISALYMMTLGADDEAIMRDYLKTNETAEKRAEMYYQKALEKSGNEILANKVRNAFLAKSEYMEPILPVLRGMSAWSNRLKFGNQ